MKTDAEQIERLKAERANRPPEPGAAPGAPSPGGGPFDPETTIPLKPWGDTVGLALDALCSALGCKSRTERESEALALTSRNYLARKTEVAQNLEAIALASVAVPLGISLALEVLKNRGLRRKGGVEDERPERTHGNNGSVGVGEIDIDEGSVAAGRPG